MVELSELTDELNGRKRGLKDDTKVLGLKYYKNSTSNYWNEGENETQLRDMK